MVSHQPGLGARLCLPLSGWGGTRRCGRQVPTGPGGCTAGRRWWPAAPATPGPRDTLEQVPAAGSACRTRGLGGPGGRRGLPRAPGG